MVVVVVMFILEQWAFSKARCTSLHHDLTNTQRSSLVAELQRKETFLNLCTTSRFLLAMGAPYLPDSVRPVFLLIGGGFFVNFVVGACTPSSKRVGFFGGPAWWHCLRPAHALLYSLAYFYPEQSRLLLLGDLALGMGMRVLAETSERSDQD